MDILIPAFQALGQVLVVGILLGAGLPALFALGIRALATHRTVVVAGSASDHASSKPTPAAIVAASLCFGLCILAVLFGIVVIVYGKQLFGV